jgi:hypothetical protein
MHRARSIRLRLGGAGNLLAQFPPRPLGMRKATYARLKQAADADEAAALNSIRDLVSLLPSETG